MQVCSIIAAKAVRNGGNVKDKENKYFKLWQDENVLECFN